MDLERGVEDAANPLGLLLAEPRAHPEVVDAGLRRAGCKKRGEKKKRKKERLKMTLSSSLF